jgi:hypothetical protein
MKERLKLRRLAPGAYDDQYGNLHISIPEILKELNLEDTPHNREAATQFINDFIARTLPKAKVIEDL